MNTSHFPGFSRAGLLRAWGATDAQIIVHMPCDHQFFVCLDDPYGNAAGSAY
jgi:hypothetical protein